MREQWHAVIGRAGAITRIRLGVAASLAAAILCCTSSAAFADVWETGTKACGTNQVGKTRGYTWGDTWNWAPVSPARSDAIHYDTGSVWKVGYNQASKTKGGWWAVSVDGVLSDSGTYATCVTTGQP